MTTTAAHTRARTAGTILVAVVLIAALLSPAYAGEKKKAVEARPTPPPVDASKLVWPPSPDIPRIKWLAATSGEEDLDPSAVPKKKKKSWMDRMAGVSLPDETGKPRLLKPYGVAVDSKGQIYVADPAARAVFVFDLDKKKVSYRGAQELTKPTAVALDDTDRLFVSDVDAHILFCFKPEGGVEYAFGADRLEKPVGLAIDNENRFLYVVDSGANRLAVFDADSFKFLRYVGKKSDQYAAPGTFDRPSFVAVDNDGNVYVTDTFNTRVQIFNADGEFIRAFGKPGNAAGNFMRPKGIAVDGDGHIYVVDTEFNNVQIFDAEGRTLMFFGARGEGPGSFMLASGICVDHLNRVIVTEQWSGRIQVFRYVSDAEAAPLYEKAAKEAEEAARKREAGPGSTR